MKFERLFINEKIPNSLSDKENNELLIKTKNGDSEARSRLISHNIKLVLRQVMNQFSNVDYDKEDLVSIGNIGLIHAVDTFDISKNIKFSTYATKCILNEINKFTKTLNTKVLSLEEPVYTESSENDDYKMKLKDIIKDDTDVEQECIDNELYSIIREFVKKLPSPDKEIIILYFGFDNHRKYNQIEIARKLHISRYNVSTTITNNLRRIKEKLEKNNDLQNTDINQSEKKQRNILTIYEFFSDYSREQINDMLTKLSESERNLVRLRYGDDLDNPKTSEKWNKETREKFYSSLVSKMKRLLSNPNMKIKRRYRKRLSRVLIKDSETKEYAKVPGITKDDYETVLKLLKKPMFNQVLQYLTIKEANVFLKKLEYIDGKFYKNEHIAKSLNMELSEVNFIIKKVFKIYRKIIMDISPRKLIIEKIDEAVKIATEEKTFIENTNGINYQKIR